MLSRFLWALCLLVCQPLSAKGHLGNLVCSAASWLHWKFCRDTLQVLDNSEGLHALCSCVVGFMFLHSNI